MDEEFFGMLESAPLGEPLNHYHSGLAVCSKHLSGLEIVCARAATSFALALLTFFACVIKLFWFSRAHQTNTTYLVVAAMAALESLLLVLKWGKFSKELWMHFAAIFLHVCQFTLVCLFYIGLALKLLRKPKLIKRVCYPIAGMVFLYFATVLILSVTEKDHTNSTSGRNAGECRKPHWIRFSASEIALAVILISASAYLTLQLKKAKTDTSITSWKTVTLWSLVSAYTLEAVVAFTFDAIFRSTDGNCDTVFGAWNSTGYNMYQMTERVSMLLPIWVLLVCWKAGPARVHMAVDEDRAYYFAAQRNGNNGGDSDGASMRFFGADATE